MRRAFVRKNPDERRVEIVDNAYKILISSGYSELTLRGVAKKTGISLSTVQHHFSSKEELIEAIISKRIDFYHSDYKNIEKGCGSDDRKKIFLHTIKYLVDDCSNRESCVFFTQMWAMSFINKDFRYFLTSMYDYHVGYLKQSLLKAYPEMDEEIAYKKSMTASCMIEGSLVHFGYDLRKENEIKANKVNLFSELVKLFDMQDIKL